MNLPFRPWEKPSQGKGLPAPFAWGCSSCLCCCCCCSCSAVLAARTWGGVSGGAAPAAGGPRCLPPKCRGKKLLSCPPFLLLLEPAPPNNRESRPASRFLGAECLFRLATVMLQLLKSRDRSIHSLSKPSDNLACFSVAVARTCVMDSVRAKLGFLKTYAVLLLANDIKNTCASIKTNPYLRKKHLLEKGN